MSHESSKTRLIRPADFAARYLNGRVIDIGCGPDPIIPHAEQFDVQDGDAQYISRYRPHAAYDAVCSSHCLEHMRDVRVALAEWWQLVRPGGHLILVVPDEDLYEQGAWPSLFNSDHKATFRLDKTETWSPVSHELRGLVSGLPDSELVSAQRQHHGYDPALRFERITSYSRLAYKVKVRAIALLQRIGMAREQGRIDRALLHLGVPVDQTAGNAVAQFEIIVRKRPVG